MAIPDRIKRNRAARAFLEGDWLLPDANVDAGARPARATAEDFTAFKFTFWRGYEHKHFQQAIDEKLAQVAAYVLSGGREGIGRLMIFVPPRHGKTYSAARYFPSWMLSLRPELRLIIASYGASLAHRSSRAVRNLIASSAYAKMYPRVRLSSDSASRSEWEIAETGGGLIAAGVGGAITGSGANLIIIDDPVKSRAEAESATFRARTATWYADDLLTRLEEPGGAIVLMNTRWHSADLAGTLLANGDEPWDVLSLPALAVANDPLGRAVGEALWEERYNTQMLESRRRTMGEYSFSSLYQQSPIPRDSGLFDALKFEIVDEAPPCTRMVRFYDLAVSSKTKADYSVGLKLGVTADERFVVLDVWRKHTAPNETGESIIQNAVIDGRGTQIRLEAENSARVHLDYLLRDPRMRPYRIDVKPPIGDKYTRATFPASRVNAGRVMLVRGAWNRAFLDELLVFPLGEHDDQVDAFSGAHDALSKRERPDWIA